MNTPASSLLRLTAACLAVLTLGALLAPGAAASGIAQAYPGERLGQVSFAVSCAPAVRAQFSRGVALLHDFWYEEARPQFEQIAKADPACAMAHWGIAMSVFHQIWDRPDEKAVALGWTRAAGGPGAPGENRPRARIHCSAQRVLQAGHARIPGPYRRLRRGHGQAIRPLPSRRRCGSVLRSVAACGGGAG